MELETLLNEGREMIDRTSKAHRERWGLGSAKRWVLDQDLGQIVWSFEDHVASAPAQILGSWNGKVSSWVWSWDNESVQAPLRTTAEEVRAIGVLNGIGALATSPLKLNEEQVRDLVAVAFRLAGATGLYHHYDGVLATYITFGPVTLEEAGGRTSTFEATAT
jgi:hypothetical protein